uniref:Thymidylate kinase n=1 Tax=Arcella intermedia TaxID=1963864 RepID=A0A6B2LIZ6_9EUKA
MVVFEGVDKAGKTTQSKSLVDSLNQLNHKAVHLRFPDRSTEIGKTLDAYLRETKEVEDHTIHLMFSANRWEARNTILKHINEGRNVVVDRYAYSGVAFTAAKGYDLNWCKGPDKGLPTPDIVFYLHLSINNAMQRGEFGSERYEKEDFQIKVQSIFEKLKEDYWVSVDASQSIDNISKTILQTTLNKINNTTTPLKQDLWQDPNSL